MLRDGQSNLLGVEKKTLLIDSRKKVDFNKNHIDGSINIPFGHLFAYEYKLNNVETIIVCGKSDNDPVAIAMSKELIKQGFKDVKTLRGGVDGWQDDYGSIESGD